MNTNIHKHQMRGVVARSARRIGLGALALTAAACTTQVADVGEIASEPGDNMSYEVADTVAELTFSDGRSIRFVSPEPGFVAISEVAPIGSRPLHDAAATRGMNAAEIYEYISGEAAPPALLAALQLDGDAGVPGAERRAARAGEVEETFEPRRVQGPQSRLADSAASLQQKARHTGTITRDDFVSSFCNEEPSIRLMPWIDVTGTGSLQRNDIYDWRSAAIAQRGRIHFTAKERTWYTWQTIANEDVPQGFYIWIAAEEMAFDFDGKASVTEADGDLYSMCTKWDP